MAATKTNICNIAQSLLGQPKLSDVDSDTGVQAAWYRESFTVVRDFALRAHPWNFAGARAVLTSEPAEQTS